MQFYHQFTVKQEYSDTPEDLVEIREDEIKHFYLFCMLPFPTERERELLLLLIELLLVLRREKRDDEIG